ncbi:MAG TPA: PAS domain-containing protein [Burkholderiaceae bacterium]|nr:PAS domain-containing protein [Burkholderiaceae bacterium]
MKTNLPVTHREYPFPDDVTLLSTTDVDSRITYANAPFVHMSGFSAEELLGQPHNIVRHPDMPVEAFADMWRTLKSGRSWTGLVKNRRKNGDHYWVRANVTPRVSGGRVVGYLSVRTKPQPGEAAAAEALYRGLREKTAGSVALHRGLIVRRGLTRPLSWMRVMSTRARLLLGTALGALVAGGGVAAAAMMAGMTALPLAIAGGAIAAGMLLTMLFHDRQVVTPLRAILAQAQTVASGQTGANLRFDRVDEIGLLMRAVSQSG